MATKTSPTAFISGANRGMGFETARQLGKRGFKIFLGCRKLKDGEAAVKKLASESIDATAITLDISSRESILAAAQKLTSLTPSLDVLVNNAAIYEDGDSNLLNLSPDILEATLRTNLLGPIYLTQALAPLLKKSAAARVVNVSSGLGELGADNGTTAPSYGISKTALNAVTKQFSAALAENNIPVNSVCPGWVRTDMGGPNAHRSVEEGVETIVWLASEAPRHITGKFLRDKEEIGW